MKDLKLVLNAFALSLAMQSIALLKIVQAEPVGDQTGSEARIVYDQRQTGKYNIHIVIKDVAIVEMNQNEIEDEAFNYEDYYYDDADLTVKPITLRPTTAAIQAPSAVTTTKEGNTSNTNFNRTQITTRLLDVEETTQNSLILLNKLLSTIPAKETDDSIIGTEPMQTNLPIAPTTSVTHTNDLPVSSTKDPQLPPTSHTKVALQDSLALNSKIRDFGNSKIYKLKVHRAKQPQGTYRTASRERRCRSTQYRDTSGNCHTKRSSSILKRLLNKLVSLPLAHNAEDHDE